MSRSKYNEMTVIIKNNKFEQRYFYQTLMAIAFSLNTGHQYLRLMMYIFFINYMLTIIFSSIYLIWTEKHTMAISMILELIQYTFWGLLQCFILMVLFLKRDAIISNYEFIETEFVESSKRNKKNQNYAYEKIICNFNRLKIPYAVIVGSITFGPLLSTINDMGELPLDHRSHFVLFWPKLFEINEFITYGIIYSIQMVFCLLVYIGVATVNLGINVILYEFINQHELLLDELQNAFKYRMEEHFELLFISCIYHHQLIIKYIDNFKSYFKWIMFFNIICIQIVLAIAIYTLTKVDSSLGYKIKIIGSIIFTMSPFLFHCNTGEVVLQMHSKLSDHIYDMPWYDMPHKNKKLIVIMFQRTQKDLSISLGVFSNKVASRSLIGHIIRQIYTILTVLLKT